MQEVIQEPIKKAKWEKFENVKVKASKVVGLLGSGGRIGIAWQIGNKEFFLGGSMNVIEIERTIKIKNSVVRVHRGTARVLDL